MKQKLQLAAADDIGVGKRERSGGGGCLQSDGGGGGGAAAEGVTVAGCNRVAVMG